MAVSAFARKLASTAQNQYNRYHLLREQEEPLASKIKDYWAGISAFPGVDAPWSAVFVSWCVRQAGATSAEFLFASGHSRFVYAGIQNQIRGIGVFRGHEVSKYVPKVGDILHNNRSGNNFNYAYAKANKKYESHSAIIFEVGVDTKGKYLRTIGGNESDSVGMKEVRLDGKGVVRNPNGLYISIIENLK